MDPVANLTEQIALANKLLDEANDDDAAIRLAELVLALVEWRKLGGSDPYPHREGM